jgi:mono/diheme cytochrome c family protein
MQFPKIRGAAVALAAILAAGSAGAQAPSSAAGTAFPELKSGEEVYKSICQGCHMPDGKGAAGAGAYPALADNPKLGAAAYPIMVVIKGQKAMPDFGSSLSDDQIAGVVEYIRTHFGNRYSEKVPSTEVPAFRPPPAKPGAAFRAG